MACFIMGILLSFKINLPTGASIVIVNIVILVAVSVIRGPQILKNIKDSSFFLVFPKVLGYDKK